MEMSVDFEKDILELNLQGYSRLEITQIIMKKYGYDEDYCFDTVRNILTKARKQMSDKEKEEIEINRELHREELKKQKSIINKEIATLVKSKAESNSSYTQASYKLDQAIKSVSVVSGISEKTIRDYVKSYCSDFYLEYSTDANLDAEHFLRLANKIIDNSISKNDATKMLGFSKMMEYLEKNNPTLLALVNDTFEYQSINGPRRFDFANTNRVNFNNVNMLVDIILEFRMPLADICDFLSENNDIFLHCADTVLPSDLERYLNSTSLSHSVEWYLAELNLDTTTDIPEEFTARKIARFNDFKIKFRILKSNKEQLAKYVSAETTVPMASVMKKISDHTYGESYYFTNDEVRNLIKNIYKYGLTEVDISHYYGIPRTSNTAVIRNFEPQDIDDQIMMAGYRKMTSYHADYFYSRLQGRS